MLTLAALALALCSAPLAAAHGYIRYAAINGGQWQIAQKIDVPSLDQTAWRNVSENIGWVGSLFLDSPAIVCGAAVTPFNTTAAPQAPFWSTADQSAGQHLEINAGGTLTLLIAGNPGKGWTHKDGHILAYLGYCGAGGADCRGVDASTLSWVKILQQPNAAGDLVAAYDAGLDGAPWNVTIPSSIRPGSYILRFELIDFDQAYASESYQDNYYPYCGQLHISGTGTDAPAGVAFPAAYAQDPRIKGGVRNYLPGPPVYGAAPAASSSSNVGAIAGGAAGGAVALLAVLGAVAWWLRRRRRVARWQTSQQRDEVDEPVDYEKAGTVEGLRTSPPTSPGLHYAAIAPHSQGPPPAAAASSTTSDSHGSTYHRGPLGGIGDAGGMAYVATPSISAPPPVPSAATRPQSSSSSSVPPASQYDRSSAVPSGVAPVGDDKAAASAYDEAAAAEVPPTYRPSL